MNSFQELTNADPTSENPDRFNGCLQRRYDEALHLALSTLLKNPVVCREGPSHCWVILFGCLVYVVDKTDNGIDVAPCTHGVLHDGACELGDEELLAPVSHGVKGVRDVLARALLQWIAEHIARTEGVPVDLREDPMFWELSLSKDAAQERTLLKCHVDDVLARVRPAEWRAIRHALRKALGPCWISLKESTRLWLAPMNSAFLGFHQSLCKANVDRRYLDGTVEATLAAHVATFRMATSEPAQRLEIRDVSEFRRGLRQLGVSDAGWRLLLQTRGRDWRPRFEYCYELEVVAKTLRIAQALDPVCLPDPSFVNLAEALEDRDVRHPANVRFWRAAYEDFLRDDSLLRVAEGGARLALTYSWSITEAMSLPDSIWSATWETMHRRAVRWRRQMIQRSAIAASHILEGNVTAMELVDDRAMKQAGELLANCLEHCDLEANKKYFMAWLGSKECAMLFERKSADAPWTVETVRGRANHPVTACFEKAALELAIILNAQKTGVRVDF